MEAGGFSHELGENWNGEDYLISTLDRDRSSRATLSVDIDKEPRFREVTCPRSHSIWGQN